MKTIKNQIILIPPRFNGLGFGSIVGSLLAYWVDKGLRFPCWGPEKSTLGELFDLKEKIEFFSHSSVNDEFKIGQNGDPLYFIFLSPTHLDLKAAHDRKIDLLRHEIPMSQIRMILLNHDIPQGISISLMKSSLGNPWFILPYDVKLIMQSENCGEPLFHVNPGSSLAKLLTQLADKIIEEHGSGEVVPAQINWDKIKKSIKKKFWNQAQHFHISQIEKLITSEIEKQIGSISNHTISSAEFKKCHEDIVHEIEGFGPLEHLLNEDGVSEIMINGHQEIFIEKNGEIKLSSLNFVSDVEYKNVINRMVSEAGRRVDTSTPLCDGRMKDGSRLNVVLPPLSASGPVITIRRFSKSIMTLEALVSSKMINTRQAQFLEDSVKNRKNILVAGNTGSGKTTLLNALSEYISPQERIITIEDALELQLRQKHVVRLETRPQNVEGQGEISMQQLVKNALRMRPDRLIIGEVRGEEVVPMIQAMNTGHDGSMSTIHANSAEDAINRLETLILMSVPQWPVSVVRKLIGHGFEYIVFLSRIRSERLCKQMIQIKYEENRIKATSI